ncbi:N(G),N(G)-dimethylarginine dimethylaminohydrolase 2 [Amia ocellicauda]|uniref:N(G),N(G)-dimethylarginine dimethylaminohydrolase 2 n=1 Tax=Amia ocellicauda TaxID=2972642 RepID=UPI0034638DB4|nr:DDAH2 dimethylaminohydrolase [Amia calva]
MAGVSSYGRFTHAVIRGIPESFGKGAAGEAEGGSSDSGPQAEVDLSKAQRQYGVLAGALRQKLGLQLIEIPPDPQLPQSWRIEDMAVIQGDTALLTRPSAAHRHGEAEALRQVLSELKMRLVEVTDEGATLDGSDVLFTGREFFIGISSRTNHKGAEVVADTFRDFAVSTVPVSGDRPLKSFCSMGGPDTIVVGGSEGAKRALKTMGQLTDHHYDILSVPDDAAANCLYVRGGSKVDYLLHRTADEYPESAAAFQKLTDYTLLPTACSEAAKLGGGLSSFCLLINRKPEI